MNPPQHRPTVLIVDDDPRIRNMIVEVLKLEGFPLETATGGQEALDILAKSSPRIVLLDLLMEPVNGWDVIHALEASPEERARHRIILVSALSNLEKYRNLEVEGRLAKPFTIDQLVNAIEAVAA